MKKYKEIFYGIGLFSLHLFIGVLSGHILILVIPGLILSSLTTYVLCKLK